MKNIIKEAKSLLANLNNKRALIKRTDLKKLLDYIELLEKNMSLWNKLTEKGKIATIIGMIIGIPTAITMTFLLVVNQDFLYIPFVIAFSIAIIFFILPSSFRVKFKDFEIEIKD